MRPKVKCIRCKRLSFYVMDWQAYKCPVHGKFRLTEEATTKIRECPVCEYKPSTNSNYCPTHGAYINIGRVQV